MYNYVELDQSYRNDITFFLTHDGDKIFGLDTIYIIDTSYSVRSSHVAQHNYKNYRINIDHSLNSNLVKYTNIYQIISWKNSN